MPITSGHLTAALLNAYRSATGGEPDSATAVDQWFRGAVQALWDGSNEDQKVKLLLDKLKIDELANVALTDLIAIQSLPACERQEAYTVARASLIRRGLVKEEHLAPILDLRVLESQVSQVWEAKDLFTQIEAAITGARHGG